MKIFPSEKVPGKKTPKMFLFTAINQSWKNFLDKIAFPILWFQCLITFVCIQTGNMLQKQHIHLKGLMPIKNLKFFNIYFDNLLYLNRFNEAERHEKFALIYMIFVLKSFYDVFLMFFPTNREDLRSQLLWGDYEVMFGMPSTLHIFSILHNILTIRMIWAVYVEESSLFYIQVYEMFVHNSRLYFSKIHVRGMDVIDFVKTITLFTLRSYGMNFVILILIIINSQMKLFLTFIIYSFEPIKWILGEVIWMFMYDNLFIMFNIQCVIVPLGVITIAMSYSRFYQSSKMLNNFTIHHGSLIKQKRFFKHFLRTFRQALKSLEQLQSLHGQTFLQYLAVVCPLNCYLYVRSTSPDLSFTTRLVLIFFALVQSSGIFGFHIYSVLYNRVIHSSTPKMYQHLLQLSPDMQLFRLRLNLHHFLYAFHTKKRYGLKYGNFGLISMHSFTKVSFSTNFDL